jgi:hypothetical protein
MRSNQSLLDLLGSEDVSKLDLSVQQHILGGTGDDTDEDSEGGGDTGTVILPTMGGGDIGTVILPSDGG